MAANLPFKIGDTVCFEDGKKGRVTDFKPLEVNDPSCGKFLYKVEWEDSSVTWQKAEEIHKKSFWQRLFGG